MSDTSPAICREVPESVAETLKQRAAAQNQSLSAYVNAQLAHVASRPSNAEIAAARP